MKKLEARKAQRCAAPELTLSRPRPVAFTGAGWAVAVVGIALAAGALVAGIWISSASWWRSRRLFWRIRVQGYAPS